MTKNFRLPLENTQEKFRVHIRRDQVATWSENPLFFEKVEKYPFSSFVQLFGLLEPEADFEVSFDCSNFSMLAMAR